MSRFTNSLVISLALSVFSISVMADDYPGIGRSATDKEISAWDIDVRPDFKGLPKGSGSVNRGQDIWESRCASCHGTFGESNEVFTPLIGGTTAEDIKNGRVAALANGKQPQKTTIMKVPTLSTLWDYIHRAMPWNEPKSLSNDDVFAVLAYLLSLAEIVPEDFTLNDQNIVDIQKKMPNRNGMSNEHGMWDVRGKPDVKSVACMHDCKVDSKIRSSLPEVAQSAHGNLQMQNRLIGPVRGIDTATKEKGGVMSVPGTDEHQSQKVTQEPSVLDIAKQRNCLACHGVQSKIVGPGFNEIASRYKSDTSAAAKLLQKVKSGGSGKWGSTPMPSQAGIPDSELQMLIKWILAGAK
jgi:S-disulfanyl-L-cysteine oxidoreductase SoxD